MEHPFLLRGGHNKAEDAGDREPAPPPKESHTGLLHLSRNFSYLLRQRLENTVNKIRNFLKLEETYEITLGHPYPFSLQPNKQA